MQDPKGNGWTTLGDVDEQGWPYVTDRKSFMIIISGGGNLYPQETKDLALDAPEGR